MKKILFALMLFLFINLFGATIYEGEDVTTDSTTYQLAKTVELTDVERMSVILKNNGDTTSYYDLRFYSERPYTGDYEYQGIATSDSTALIDTSATFATDGSLIGEIVYNKTDGSQGYITKADTTYIHATLSGGTDNEWDTNDVYYITSPKLYYSVSDTLTSSSQATLTYTNYYSQFSLFLKKTASADSTVEFRMDYNLEIER